MFWRATIKNNSFKIAMIFLVITSTLSGCMDINVDEDITKMSITSFNVEPDIIELGETAKLSWMVIGADTVSIDNEIGLVSLMGDTVIQPTETTTYVLTATNNTKSITANTKIIVNELNEEDDEIIDTKSDLEVISYTVETQTMKYGNIFEKIADGFSYSENAYRYLVRGKVKNNGTENISKAWITVNFYDKEDNLIYSQSDIIFNFETNDIRDFSVDFTKYDSEDFPNADHIGFTFMKE